MGKFDLAREWLVALKDMRVKYIEVAGGKDKVSLSYKKDLKAIDMAISVIDKATERGFGRVKKIDDVKFDTFNSFFGAYAEFYKNSTGFPVKMDALNGKALKGIIAYLVETSKTKDEAGALMAWQYVLKNWEGITPFLQGQKGLLQINKNLSEILDQLRNGNYKTKQSGAGSIRETERVAESLLARRFKS